MNGVINFLKPPGMSSNGAVVFVRGLLGGQKAGHAGTLDPGACGVLPVCVGRATKLSSYLMGSEKEYIAEILFGKSTDTGDSYGRLTGTDDSRLPEPSEVRNVLAGFLGQTVQRTPAYSAAKYQGSALYKLARRGIEAPPKQRDIVIREIEYMTNTCLDAHLFRLVCGKGTYVRTLCEDIGRALGTIAYMSFLVRTKCSGLNIEDSYTADELARPGIIDEAVLPADGFLIDLPKVTAELNKRQVLFNGGVIECNEKDIPSARVYIEDELLGLGRAENNRLKMTLLLVDR